MIALKATVWTRIIKVDDGFRSIVSLPLYCEPEMHLCTSASEAARGGAKRRRESIVNENSKVAPPGLSSFRHPCALHDQIPKFGVYLRDIFLGSEI